MQDDYREYDPDTDAIGEAVDGEPEPKPTLTAEKRAAKVNQIRALLAKTTEAGCTEEEVNAALTIAAKLMADYEVTDAELAETKEEKAIIMEEPHGSTDPHQIKFYLLNGIGRFTDTEAYRLGTDTGRMAFVGLPSDCELAAFLLDTLSEFIAKEMANHMAAFVPPPGDRAARQRERTGFMYGATSRVSQRLRDLKAANVVVATSNSKALAVVKTHLVKEKMRAAGLHFRSARSSSRQFSTSGFRAGTDAGDRASLHRPIGGSGSAALRLR